MTDIADFRTFFEETLQRLLPSALPVAVPEQLGFVDLAFDTPQDFIAAVAAAEGANIRIDTSFRFEKGWRRLRRMRSVEMRLIVLPQCQDARLTIFLEDLLLTLKACAVVVPDRESIIESLVRYRDVLPWGDEPLNMADTNG